MSDDLTCSSCGARVTPGLQWCSLCHADLRPQPSPEELAALPPPQVQPPNAPQTAADIQRTSPPPPTGIPIPPPSVGGQAQPPRGAHPIPPPPSAGQASSPGSVGPANPQNIEQWGALLASSESQQQSRLPSLGFVSTGNPFSLGQQPTHPTKQSTHIKKHTEFGRQPLNKCPHRPRTNP